MKIPIIFYGKAENVGKAVKQVANDLRKGKAPDEVFTGEFTDTSSLQGLMVIDGPSPLLGSNEHFHIYTLTKELCFDLKTPIEPKEKLFNHCIKHNWGILLLMGFGGITLIDENPKKQQVFLKACYENFKALTALGKRYSVGGDATSLAALPNAIYFCLAKQEVDVSKAIKSRDMQTLYGLLDTYIRTTEAGS